MLLKAYGWLEKKFTAAFRLKEDSHLTKFTAKYETESVNHLWL